MIKKIVDIWPKILIVGQLAGYSAAGLARAIGMTPQGLNSKRMLGSFNIQDLAKICKATDCRLLFETKDGDRFELVGRQDT